MIYVLKKDEHYVAAVIGTLRVDTMTNGMMHRQRVPGTKVQFKMTKDIKQAKLVEDPNMDAVNKYGLTAHVVHADQPIIKEIGNVYEQSICD